MKKDKYNLVLEDGSRYTKKKLRRLEAHFDGIGMPEIAEEYEDLLEAAIDLGVEELPRLTLS